MAKGKHISEDEIKYIVDVESAKAQQEIRKLEKSTDSLRSKNQQRLREMIKLEAQGKKESQHYKNLRKEYNELNKKIKDNIARAEVGVGVIVTSRTDSHSRRTVGEYGGGEWFGVLVVFS